MTENKTGIITFHGRAPWEDAIIGPGIHPNMYLSSNSQEGKSDKFSQGSRMKYMGLKQGYDRIKIGMCYFDHCEW